MRILITNDDGIYALGLQQLCAALAPLAELIVVAPAEQMSSVSHSLTLRKPLRVKQVDLPNTVQAYSLAGTPADCGKWAVEYLLAKNPPDLVVSGINFGPNTGWDVIYSGTVAAAMEGYLKQIPALAVSLDVRPQEAADFTVAAAVTADLVNRWATRNFQPNALLNVNVPNLPAEKIKGIQTCRMGIREYSEIFSQIEAIDGDAAFVISGYPLAAISGDSSDVGYLARGFVTVVPLHTDSTNYEQMDAVQSIFTR